MKRFSTFHKIIDVVVAASVLLALFIGLYNSIKQLRIENYRVVVIDQNQLMFSIFFLLFGILLMVMVFLIKKILKKLL